MSDPRTALERLLGAAKVGTLDDPAVGRALPMATPASEEEIAETVRLAATERWTIVPLGLGSKLSWNPPPARADFALSTRNHAGIVAYEPGDGTLTARAGSTIDALAEAARKEGNRLTPRVPCPENATLGGVLAAGQSGIDRLRQGPSRHHVLGMRVVLADGSAVKSGGRLVKNVTGYDMHRLYCGSHGSLCVIVEASMRLASAFESEVVVTAAARDRTEAIARANTALALDLQPLCVRAENVLDPAGAWRTHVVLAGRPGFVEWARRAALQAIPGSKVGVETVERIRDAELAGGRWPRVRVAGRPSRLAPALATLGEGERMIVEPSIAVAEIVDGSDELVRRLREQGLEVTVRGEVPARAPGPAEDVAERLRAALDPAGVFARL